MRITSLLVPALVLTLAACGSDDGQPATPVETPDSAAPDTADVMAEATPAARETPATPADPSSPTSAAPMPDATEHAAHSGKAIIPLLNGTCPGGIEVHADEGGPIFVNGKEGALKKFSDSYFESASGDLTISLTINPDGSPSMSYTGPNRAHGICTIK